MSVPISAVQAGRIRDAMRLSLIVLLVGAVLSSSIGQLFKELRVYGLPVAPPEPVPTAADQ